jgi:CBS domain-containing protein
MTHVNRKVTVEDVMTRGVVDAAPQTPLHELAAKMAEHGVHCVVVDGLARGLGGSEKLVWGIVSDMDLIAAAASGRAGVSAGELAATEIVTVAPSEPVEQAVRLMAQHECPHVIVVSGDGQPVGVVSSLDVAEALACAGTVS